MQEKSKADKLKVRFCHEGGDLMTMLNVYRESFAIHFPKSVIVLLTTAPTNSSVDMAVSINARGGACTKSNSKGATPRRVKLIS
jgi:hypothetical protein